MAEVMRVQGNSEVCKLLDFWRGEAEKGRLNAIALAASDGVSLGIDYTGATGYSEYMLYFGVDGLRQRIAEQVWNRQAPRSKIALNDKLKANKQVYNAANLTPGFDFLAWLIAAEQRRIKHKAPYPLQVAIHFERGWDSDPNKRYDVLMFNNVMLPLIKMIGGVYVEKIEDDFLWPPTGCFLEAVEFTNEGIPVPRLAAHPDAVLAMEQFKDAVTITLREATHWPQRNSDLDVWLKVAEWLENQGERVVFVRDTEKAKEPITGYETVPEASININCRAALYAGAKANLFISNGPGTLDWFCSDAASLMWIPLADDDGYKCSRPSWWLPNHGIDAGGQFPWFKGKKKKIVWEVPTFEGVVKEYTELMDAKQESETSKVHGGVLARSKLSLLSSAAGQQGIQSGGQGREDAA